MELGFFVVVVGFDFDDAKGSHASQKGSHVSQSFIQDKEIKDIQDG